MQPNLFLPPAPTPIGSPLAAQLAPLDDIAPLASFPTTLDEQKAYALGMLAADLTAHAPSLHLLAICKHYGWDEAEALTIGRAIASMLVRLAQRVEAPHE